MSIEFINQGCNQKSLEKAKRQEKQLTYFTQSKLQDSYLSESQIELWSKKDFQSDDHFLNYIKSVFLTENFQLFAKYLRFPLPSAKLVKNIIEPQLNRVFVSDNSFFEYEGLEFDKSELEINDFETELFNRYLYKHNSILICDSENEKAYRYFIDIEDVYSIEHNNKSITKISFKGVIDGQVVKIYIDNEKYAAYTKSGLLIKESIHNLGYCPAFFIAPVMDNDFIVRRSVFSYIREDMENYVFLSTLLKMSEPNGAIPIVSTLDVAVESESNNHNSIPAQPNSDYIIGSQSPEIYGNNPKQVTKTSGILQAGSVNKIPVIRKDDGSVDMDAVKYFINFHYLPVESLKYIKDRIKEYESNIITTIIGDVVSSSEASKNESQIAKSIIVLENTLIALADDFNQVRENSDKALLDLTYGLGRVEPCIFYGTSFFLQNESDLMNQFATAPNPLERRNILATLNRNRFKNNSDLRERGELLYKLMPFVSDLDFNNAKASGLVTPEMATLYLQFDLWVSRFEAEYGNIVEFYEYMSEDKSESLTLIKNILLNLIKQENGNTGKDSGADDQT